VDPRGWRVALGLSWRALKPRPRVAASGGSSDRLAEWLPGVSSAGPERPPRWANELDARRNIRATMGSRVMVSLRREHNARAAGVRSCSIVRDARAARAHARRGREARWSGLCSRTARQSKRPTRRSRPALVDVREQVLQMRFRAANRRVSSSWPECYSRLFETRARAGRRFGRGHDAPRTLL